MYFPPEFEQFVTPEIKAAMADFYDEHVVAANVRKAHVDLCQIVLMALMHEMERQRGKFQDSVQKAFSETNS